MATNFGFSSDTPALDLIEGIHDVACWVSNVISSAYEGYDVAHTGPDGDILTKDGPEPDIDELLAYTYRRLPAGRRQARRLVVERMLHLLDAEDRIDAENGDDTVLLPAAEAAIPSSPTFPATMAVSIVMECLVLTQQNLIDGWFDADNSVQRSFTLEDAIETALYEQSQWSAASAEPFTMVADALVGQAKNYLMTKEGQLKARPRTIEKAAKEPAEVAAAK